MRLWVGARRGVVLVVVLVAGVAGTVVPAQAATSSTSYAALGDSYSAGVGAGAEDPASGSCRRSPRAYTALWAASHQPADFAFVACSGGTTTSVVTSQLGVLNRRTTLVTLTVGGDDVGFAEVVAVCLLGSTSTCSAAVSAALAVARTVLPAELAVTYGGIRWKAPKARLVVLGYPRLFETAPPTCGPTGMSQANRAVVNAGGDVLNSVIQSRAAAAGATFVDVRPWFAGHGVCGSDPWINSSLADVSIAFHPNPAGYAQGYLPALESVTTHS